MLTSRIPDHRKQVAVKQVARLVMAIFEIHEGWRHFTFADDKPRIVTGPAKRDCSSPCISGYIARRTVHGAESDVCDWGSPDLTDNHLVPADPHRAGTILAHWG